MNNQKNGFLLRAIWASIIVFGALLVFGIGGCTANRGRPLEELSKNKDDTEPYRVRRGDVLMIDVWGEQKLSGERLVRDDGQLTMPLAGDVIAADKTLEELGVAITEKLQKFVPAATVSASISHSAPMRYYLFGKFQRPGEYRSDAKITLLQAIAVGGGLTPFANEGGLTIIRRTPSGEIRYVLDLVRVVDGREPNPELKDGDVIRVD